MSADPLRYGGQIDPQDTNDPRSRIVRMVPPGSHVLEIGCGTGTIISYLVSNRSCSGMGVEVDCAMAKEATAQGVRVVLGDIETPELHTLLAAEPRFDTVIAADVLEHLRSPQTMLVAARAWQGSDSRFLASVPNVAFWRLRLMLLRGRWEYTAGHIMDQTHLRWYTLETVIRLFTVAGYHVEEVQFRWVPLPGDHLWRRLWPGRFRLYAWLVSRWPGLFAYQFVVRARPVHGQGS